jgi:hypothetical protein
VTSPACTGSFRRAARAYATGGKADGIAWVFRRPFGLVGIDFDGCRDPATGALAPAVREWARELGTYCEVSPSGAGIKLVAFGELPWPGATSKGGGYKVEVYADRRHFAMTGHPTPGTPCAVRPAQRAIDRLVAEAFPERPLGGDHALYNGAASLGDEELVARAMRAANGPKFSRLWAGSWEEDYPSHSEADAALLCMLAFWAADDADRMERLFSASALGLREKWTSRPDYRARSIRFALSRHSLSQSPPPSVATEESETLYPSGSESLIEGGEHPPPVQTGGQESDAVQIDRASPLESAWGKALAGPLPPEANRYREMGMRRLVALCRVLQQRAGDAPFFLAREDAGGLLGVTGGAAGRKLRRLVTDGVLELVRRGNSLTHRASEYRYGGSPGAAEPASGAAGTEAALAQP